MSRLRAQHRPRLAAHALITAWLVLLPSSLFAAGAHADILITSTPPDADVYVDALHIGRTPIRTTALQRGSHRVRIVKSGYLEHARSLDVEAGRAATLHVALTARLAQTARPAQTPALRIIVIEGDDAINIVQQGTAGQVVVEVRDRNDLPVSGVLVLFTIDDGRRSTLTAGSRELTVTTTATGRAAIVLTPVAVGAVRIDVRATRGGDVATRSILQRNIDTAAVTNPVQRPGVTGGSGGLSKPLLLTIAAGAGAATIGAVKLAGRSSLTSGAITASPTTALVGATPVTFTSTSSDSGSGGLTYTWAFGDGDSGSGPTITHVYQRAGQFVARLTISDGEDSATSETTVTAKSVDGTWRSDPLPTIAGGAAVSVTLAQNGGTITGTFTQGSGSGPVAAGAVRPTSPQVSFTITPSFPGFTSFTPFVFTGDPNVEITVLTGILNGSGFANTPIVLVRQ